MAETDTAAWAVPAEDSALPEALQALDSKLTAWIEAVAEVQRTFKERAAHLALGAGRPASPAGDGPGPRDTAPSPSPRSTVGRAPDAATGATAATGTTDVSRSQPAPQESKPRGRTSAEGQASPGPRRAEQIAEPAPAVTPNVDHAAQRKREELQAQNDIREQTQREERELLGTLDSKIRMEIRVRRRVDASKSVQEHLEEILATAPQSEDRSKEKKWWKRGGNK